MIKKKDLFLIFFFIVIFNSSFLYAKYKKEIIKSISITEEYDDNIYLLREKDSDWITTVSPEIAFDISSRRSFLGLSYSPTWSIYKKHSESNTLRQFLSLNSGHGIKKHLWFYLSDQYEKSEEPIEQIGTWRSQAIRKTRNTYQRNTFDTSMKWKYKKKSDINIGFKHEFLENTDPTYDNSTQYGPYIRFSYWSSVKNGLEVDYRYKENRTSRDIGEPSIPDFNGYDLGLKYTHFFNRLTDIYIRHKHVERNFLKPGVRTLTVNEYSLGMDKAFSPKLSISFELFYFRPHGFTEDKNYTGYFFKIERNYKKQQINITYKKSWDEGYLESERREFTRYNLFSLTYKRTLAKDTILTAGYYYRKNIYQQIGSSDKNYQISAVLSKSINKWLILILSYSHLERTSTTPEDEFKDNKVGLTIKMISK